MSKLPLILLILVVALTFEYEFKCPESGEWRLRAIGFNCSLSSQYVCLFRYPEREYHETCDGLDYSSIGSKLIYEPFFNKAYCSYERYQPFPFSTDGSSKCLYQKTFCSEKGQYVFQKGSIRSDISCGCDLTRGYEFVSMPKHECYCIPSEEDCSCQKIPCNDLVDQCPKDADEITTRSMSTTLKKNRFSDAINIFDHVNNGKNYRFQCLYITLVLSAVMIIVVTLFYALYKHLKGYFIDEPLSDIKVVEGQFLELKYKLLIYSTSYFLKNNRRLPEDKRMKKKGLQRSLKISKVTLDDVGKYCLGVAGYRSRLTNVTVQVMFTTVTKKYDCIEGSTIELTCSVYAENIRVKWFKDNTELLDCTNISMTSNGNDRTLRIKETAVTDDGTYFVKANNVEMEMSLTVKGIFKHRLVDMAIMEGLELKLECESKDEKASVQWFKDNKEIINPKDLLKEEKTQNRIHILLISKTSIKDSGTYSINIDGARSYAKVEVKEMPTTIKHMSVYDREAFLKAAKTKTKKRYNIRVMIVGKQKAGKTSLLRRLMNEEIDAVKSTDGMNIQRRTCHVNIKTGEWHFFSSVNNLQDFSTDQQEEFADCGFWDFAGQKEFSMFYATHQTFLCSNAVYLLVVDISEDFKKYIDLWLDNIHCYCTDDKKTPTQGTKDAFLNPPVIIVGTGIDKVPSNDREDRKRKFRTHLSDTISTQPKRRHFRKLYFLSNKFPSHTRQEFKELRKDIFCKAKDLSNWEENLPVRWVELEKKICSIKVKKDILHGEAEGQTPAFENKKVMFHTEAQSLADECSFPNVKQEISELDSFLKYEHEIGNIVFFKEVKEYIVLDLEWLVDVFRCFVSHENNDDTLGMTEWDVLVRTGKLEDTLIEKLLQKVPCLILRKHKNYLLELMEEFSIIVKPKSSASVNDIYMPCMIKPRPFQEILGKVDVETEYCKKSSWFCLVFNFLPPSYFNHILVSFVKNNPLFCDKKDSRLGIYHNVGIFQLNNTGSEILVMCLSKNLIAMKVVQFNSCEDVCYSYIKTQLINLVDSIKLRYRINVNYEIRFKCQGGSLYDNEGIGYDEAMEKSEYRCTDHNEMHSSRSIYKYWLKEEEVEDELNKKGRRKCNNCKNMSVYNCYDCNAVLCKDCSRKHNEENKNQLHLMQLISNSFILNFKFRVTPFYHVSISDIKYLLNGELIVSLEQEQVVKIFSIIGIQKNVIQLQYSPLKMTVVDKHTVAVLLDNNSIAFVDIQQSHVQYILDIAIPYSSDTFIYIENEFYISNKHGIVVVDMSGSVKRSITLSFKPCDMCYDVDLQHIYCIGIDRSQLICIDRDGNNIFTFTDPNQTNLRSITIDNDGNVLVLCGKEDDNSFYVIKVDSNGENSEVVITDIKTSPCDTHIFYDHLTNSVVIGASYEVYIYKKK